MFYWIAYYNDGSELKQKPGITYEDIDRPRLTAFSLFNENNVPLVMVDFRKDYKSDSDIGPRRLIWRRRGLISTKGAEQHIHLVGWQRKVAGQSIQAVCYVIEPEGTVILGGQWTDDIPLMNAIKPLAHEIDLNE